MEVKIMKWLDKYDYGALLPCNEVAVRQLAKEGKVTIGSDGYFYKKRFATEEYRRMANTLLGVLKNPYSSQD